MEQKPKTEELIIEARNFFDYYKKELGKSIREGQNVMLINFSDLASFSHLLSDLLLSHPEETFQVMETSLQESGLVNNPRIRMTELPEEFSEKIRNLRAKHLNRLIQVEGIVRQASEVRPQVVSAKFECPSCGTVLSLLQVESKFREPTRCSCGRRGSFKLLSKDMVDAQRIVVEEAPDNLSGGEQPRRLSIFLKEDLVEPKMEEKTTPGSRIKVIGILKEIARHSQTGGTLTRYDIAVEANNLIAMEETFENLDISDEDEKQIEELAADKQVLEKFTSSIAPSIYGYEEVKKSLVLQLFSGVGRKRSDGTHSRGDIHILLVGDPGVAKSIGENEKILYHTADSYGYLSIKEIHQIFGNLPKNLKVLTIDKEKHTTRWCDVKEIIKHTPENSLIKVKTEHGKEILATKDHSFITLTNNGEISAIRGDRLTKDSYLPIPLNFHKPLLTHLDTQKFNTYKTNSRQLPKKIKLDWQFGFLMGIFLSEGNIRGGKDILISSKNKAIRKIVKKAIDNLRLTCRFEVSAVLTASKSLSNLLTYYCYNNKKKVTSKVKGGYSRIKKIPEFAYFAPIGFINGMLSGIFSGDGRYISEKNKARGIELVTVSKELANNTSDLLFSIGLKNRVITKSLRLPHLKRCGLFGTLGCSKFNSILKDGVFSKNFDITRNYKYKNKKTEYYLLHIPSYMLGNFFKNIKFLRKKLSFSQPIYSYHDLIPCGDLLYQLTKKLGLNKRIGGNRTIAAEMRTVKSRNKIGRIRLLNLLKLFSMKYRVENIEEYQKLKKIADSSIVWSKVESIKNVKRTSEVYDLYIPETNTFVANGLGVHNSVILKYISSIAPKGRYVAGKGASGAGITATVVRDEFLRGWSLEAGAMVLSNKGVVCIDEMDKMDPQDRSAMHEAMEQQTVTISKANVQASLRAETSVLAAANPKFGRFDPYQTVPSQIDIPPTLINRFDVVFILKDLPSREMDEAIASHVLSEHKEKKAVQIIDKDLFRKYIAYAKQKIKPKLTEEATSEIKKFYVNLRNAPAGLAGSSDMATRPLPISARQLEALIRMAEASAKVKLAKEVTKEDAKIAIDLMKYYLTQVGFDYETKTFDIDRIATGISTSQRSKIMQMKDTLSILESRLGKLIPVEEIKQELAGKMQDKELEEALDKLTIAGEIFHPRKGFVQRV